VPHRAVGVSTVAAAVFMAAVAITITGCSSGGPVVHDPIVRDSPVEILVPSPSSSASAKIVESSDTVLQAHLLTLSDLPAGWKQDTDTSADNDSSCTAISDPAYSHLPLQAKAHFTSGASMPSLTETLAYGSTAQVDAAWTDYAQAITSCGHLTMRLAGQTLSLTLTQMPYPRTGNPTDARQAVTTEGRTASIYFVVIRKGNLLESVTYSDWGTPSVSEAQRFAEAADAATAEIR
jgi:hypothetical protein